MNKIKKIDIVRRVRKRKYAIEKDLLVSLLREKRKEKKMAISFISEELGVKMTEAEHWFRTDGGFSVPNENLWYRLKELLGINTTYFDKQITCFVEQNGVFEKSGRIYNASGLSPTLTRSCGNELFFFEKKNIKKEYVDKSKKTNFIKEFTYASMCAGFGGMSMALEGIGGKCIGAWEHDPFSKQKQHAKNTHMLLFPHIKVNGDVKEIDNEKLPDFDLLCFTPPCQSFSVNGKREGFEDTRGTVIFDILKVVECKKPKVLFMENVKGLVNHDNGKTISVIINSINKLGYIVDFEVINSKDFGVAQNRERVYMVAVRKDIKEAEEWKIGKKDNVVNVNKRRLSEEGVDSFNFDFPYSCGFTSSVYDFLDPEVDIKYEAPKRIHEDLKSQTDVHFTNVRGLTPREALRLQSVEESYIDIMEKELTDEVIFKLVGNGLTINVVKSISERLMKYL